jgi:hypothetical protein
MLDRLGSCVEQVKGETRLFSSSYLVVVLVVDV